MGNKTWEKSIIEVLKSSDEPLTRTEIAEQIVSRGFREDVGLTPANTVVSYISTSLKKKGEESPFVRVGRGEYWLRELFQQQPKGDIDEQIEEDSDESSLISAFGMFWDRSKVNWQKTSPPLLGIEQSGAKPIDFSNQIGIYVLYDNHRPIYVGRATTDRLGKRLREHHTISRFRGRWNRFSWFGLCGIDSKGQLLPASVPHSPEETIISLESLLIETLEPVQNRRRGDGFSAVEYLQYDDPELENEQIKNEVIKRLLNN